MSEEETAIVKATVIEVESQVSNAIGTTEDDQRVFSQYGAILPPYDPRQLTAMFERSTSLRPNVDAYCTNIEAFGYRFEPTIDLKSDEVDELIQDAMILEKLADDDPTPDVPKEEVQARKLTLEAEMRVEKLKAEQFFKNLCSDMSFIELRERTRQDLEITGNAYWEVLRNNAGRVCQIVLLPAISMRLMRAETRYTEVDEQRKVGALAYRRFRVKRRFRQFVQVVYGQFTAYFKELDDPRVVSARTGRTYSNRESLDRSEPGTAPATEVIHFKIPSSMSAYGVPRWVGATLAVLGSRESEEVNVTYFNNKAVPPMAILVSGGVLAKGTADRITNYIRDNIAGKDNFHKVLILEAEGAGGSVMGQTGSRVRIEIKNLMESQNTDALFQVYESNNTEKVGNQFRLPKILRGDTKDFNRATADAALQYAEQQVFQPERNKVDHFINKRLMPLVGVKYFEYVSNSPVSKDSNELADNIAKLAEQGILTPADGRELAFDVFNKQLKKIEAPWLDKPIKLTLAEATAAVAPPTTPVQNDLSGAPPGEELARTAERLIQLRAALHEYEGRAQTAQLQLARTNEANAVHHVPQSEWSKWFEPQAAE